MTNLDPTWRGHAGDLISVDVETSGPSPGTGSLLAIGACLVDEPAQSFYRELQPDPGTAWDPDAAPVHGLDRAGWSGMGWHRSRP